jgi:DNA invertase Pin-like site-specific DNA recombinase
MEQERDKQLEAVIYTRTAAGGPGPLLMQTIELQCAVWATSPRLRVRGVYADQNVSGTTRRRPGLDRMLRDIRRAPVACVLATDRTRLGRNVAVLGDIEREIEASGACIIGSREDWRRLRHVPREGANNAIHR